LFFCIGPVNTKTAGANGLFDRYFDQAARINTDKFVDEIRANQVNIDDQQIVDFLESLTKSDLQRIRNTFYAKRGLMFQTPEWQEYFSHKSWYEPKETNVILPENEVKIITRILQIEKCEDVTFADFHKIFPRLQLPIKYNDKLKRKTISMVNVRKFLNDKIDIYLPYYAIGELYNKSFVVLLYEISSLETQPHIATFTPSGQIISDKAFFSIGGDISFYTDGQLSIDKDLTIHVHIKESSDTDKTTKTIDEKYLIDSHGNIVKKK